MVNISTEIVRDICELSKKRLEVNISHGIVTSGTKEMDDMVDDLIEGDRTEYVQLYNAIDNLSQSEFADLAVIFHIGKNDIVMKSQAQFEALKHKDIVICTTVDVITGHKYLHKYLLSGLSNISIYVNGV